MFNLKPLIATGAAVLALSSVFNATSSLATTPVKITYVADNASETTRAQSGTFAKKTYSVKGGWSVITRNGQTFIKLSDDFKTKNGPDLKIFISPLSATDVNGKTATAGSIKLGALKSNKGAQEYLVPAGVNLADFNSVLVHCEAYSKLWAAGDLT